MRIYIPTLNRVEQQYTFNALPQAWQAKTALVCPPSEAADHEARGRPTLPHPADCHGIAQVRQWIVENATTDRVILADDDLRFFRRHDGKLHKATTADLEEMLAWFADALDDVHFAGLDSRYFNNARPQRYQECREQLTFLAYRRSTLLREGIRFDDVDLMEDQHVTLSLLERGYPNRVLCDFCFDQAKGSNAPGGCSTYRNREKQRKAAFRLWQLHKPYVSFKTSRSKSGWNGMEQRCEVRIAWKKACQRAPA